MTNLTVLHLIHLIWSSNWNIFCGLKISGYFVKAVIAIQSRITVSTTNAISNSLKTKSALVQKALLIFPDLIDLKSQWLLYLNIHHEFVRKQLYFRTMKFLSNIGLNSNWEAMLTTFNIIKSNVNIIKVMFQKKIIMLKLLPQFYDWSVVL